METKYLYVSLSGGLNDRMSNIYRAYKYCSRMKRTLLVDFKTNEYSPNKDYNINLIKILTFKQNDIIYLKGHVGVALNNKKLIHAYGPMKKTVVMDIDQTIKIINKTANLKVISIKRL